MQRQAWKNYLRNWKKFKAWEDGQSRHLNARQTLHLIGQYVDFYLSRYPRKPKRPDVSGIERMRQALSCLS